MNRLRDGEVERDPDHADDHRAAAQYDGHHAALLPVLVDCEARDACCTQDTPVQYS